MRSTAPLSVMARTRVGLVVLAVHLPVHVCALRTPPRFSDFVPLTSPQAYTKLLTEVATDEITVIKWAADSCRTCRAAQPKIRSIMKRWDADTPSAASFYSVDLRTENKDLMFDFFKERNVTHMPFIELYVGDQRVHSLVVPPSRTSFLRVALGDAADFVRDGRRQRARRNLLLQLRESRQELSRLERERRLLRRRWKLMGLRGLLSGTTPQRQIDHRRRITLGELRTVMSERQALLADTRKLERRRALYRRFIVMPQRRKVRRGVIE